MSRGRGEGGKTTESSGGGGTSPLSSPFVWRENRSGETGAAEGQGCWAMGESFANTGAQRTQGPLPHGRAIGGALWQSVFTERVPEAKSQI